MMPQIVVVCGCRNSGKTTWVCALTEALSASGWRVGSVKHTHHDCNPPGKDSTRHQAAGAARVLLVSPVGATCYDAWSEEPELADLVRQNFDGFDLVLVEGYRESHWPKFVVGEDPRANPANVIGRLPPLTGPPNAATLFDASVVLMDHLSRRDPVSKPESQSGERDERH